MECSSAVGPRSGECQIATRIFTILRNVVNKAQKDVLVSTESTPYEWQALQLVGATIDSFSFFTAL